MRCLTKKLGWLFLLFTALSLSAQESRITWTGGAMPLDQVLESISTQFPVRFAFDPAVFRNINFEIEVKKISVGDFLKLLDQKYSVKSTQIGETWVLTCIQPKEKPAPAGLKEQPAPDPVRVSGYVRDIKTGENLLYCNVISGENTGTMTNDLGYFTIRLTGPDTVRIRVSHLGYRMLDTLVNANEPVKLNLIPLEYLIQDIDVKPEEKYILETVSGSEKTGFNPLRSSNVPRMASDDMINALLIIPGLSFQQGNSAGLSVRGGAPADNLVLLDGIPVLETSHLLGNMSVLNSNYIHQAFVSKGGFDAEYGEKAAGMVELIGKSGKNSNSYLDVSANLLNFNALVNVAAGKNFSVTAAWRRSFVDNWKNFLYFRLVEDVIHNPEEENEVTSAIYPVLRYQDINAKLSFHPSENFMVNLNLLYSDDFQNRDFALLQTTDYYRNEQIQSQSLGMSFNASWQINRQWHQSLTAGFSTLDKEIIDETGELEEVTEVVVNPGQGQGKGKGLVKTREKTYSRQVFDIDNGTNSINGYRIFWKTAYKTSLFTHQAGMGWSASDFSYFFNASRTFAGHPVDSVKRDANQYLFTAFAQQQYQPWDNLHLRWGIRANTDLTSRKTYWQPRGGIEFYPADGIVLNYSGGIYYQFLSGVKRIDSEGHYSHVWSLPDADGSGTVRAVHHVGGVTVEKMGWLFRAEGYLRSLTGKSNLLARYVSDGVNQVVVYFPHSGDEYARGADFFVQKRQGWFSHMIGYSLSLNREKIAELMDNEWFPGYNHRLHRLKLTEMVNWKNWSLTGSWQWESGLPVVNLAEDNSRWNIQRTPGFSQADLALVKTWRTSHVHARAGVSLLNLLNRKNIVEVDYLRFSSSQGSLSVRSDISALGFTPLFFLNFRIL